MIRSVDPNHKPQITVDFNHKLRTLRNLFIEDPQKKLQESCRLLEEAHQLDPENRQYKTDLDTVKSIMKQWGIS